jgi:phasin family protein
VQRTIDGCAGERAFRADNEKQYLSVWERISHVIKVEEIQQYGKEQFESAMASAATLQSGMQAIATATGDYTKKSFEDGNAFLGKLASVKSLDKAMEVQSEYAKSAYEAFVAESHKISELYVDLAKQAYKPFEGFVAKMTPAR